MLTLKSRLINNRLRPVPEYTSPIISMADHSVLKSLEQVQCESVIICSSFKELISGSALEVEANILPIFFVKTAEVYHPTNFVFRNSRNKQYETNDFVLPSPSLTQNDD